MPPFLRVTRRNLARAVGTVARADPDLAAVVATHGHPPLWAREPGFPTLVRIILEQQVSLASARACFDRLRAAADPLTPEALLRLDDAELLAIGFSHQKAETCRGLAHALLDGAFDLTTLAVVETETARQALLALRGVGPWTADIYLLMALGHRDVWPVGDLALAKSMRVVKRLVSTPDRAQQERLAEAWRPWRSVAARLLWHDYLQRRADGGDS